MIQSEKELVGDLLSLNPLYERLKTSGTLSPAELAIVFGSYSELSVCHQELVSLLISQRDENGRFDTIGISILKWIHELENYK